MGNKIDNLQEQKSSNDKVLNFKEKVYINLYEKSNKIIEDKNDLNNKFNIKLNKHGEWNKSIEEEILIKQKEINNLKKEKKILEEKIFKRNKIIMKN